MKKYVFKPYSKSFPKLFNKEKERILSLIKKDIIIEHIGSTAVLGLGGKGIIDIAIAVDKRRVKSVSKKLQDLGYEFKPQGGSDERYFFQITLPDKEGINKTYYVHLIHNNSKEFINMLAFRDFLKSNPAEAKEYAAAKEKAARQANEDRDKYIKLKGPTIERISESILKEQKL